MESTNEHVPQRDDRGRWLPGQTGNAKGRRRGMPSFVTLVEQVAEQQGVTLDEAVCTVVEAVLRRAAAGDLEAAKLILARVPDVAERAGLLVVDDEGAPGRFAPDAAYVAEVDRVMRALAPAGVVDRADAAEAEREERIARLLA